jgi:hypothetical protein
MIGSHGTNEEDLNGDMLIILLIGGCNGKFLNYLWFFILYK